jgi:hypothetical protein
MERYTIRAVKYLFAICVLYVGMMWIMHQYDNPFDLTFQQRMELIFATWRGWGMVVATIALALTYPYFGYVKRSIEGSVVADREQIDRAADFTGLKFVGEADGELIYRAVGLRRLVLLFEDEVRVRQCGDKIEVSGLRRIAARMALDAERYITNKRRAGVE